MKLGFASRADQAQQLEHVAFTVIDELRTLGRPAGYVEPVEHQLVRSAQLAERSSAFWLDHLLDACRQGRDRFRDECGKLSCRQCR